MVSWFYFIVFVASLIMIGNFLRRNKRIDTLYMLFSILVSINALGRWLVSISQTVEQAIWATKIMYVGACYIMLALIIILARLCEIKIPTAITVILSIYATFVFGLVITIGFNDLYYKTFELAQGNGYNYLEKEYGPLHILYPILNLIECAVVIVIVIASFKKKNKIPFSLIFTSGALSVVVMVTYLMTRIFKSSIEWLSLGYLVTIIVITIRFEKVNMYDMTTNIAISVEKMQEYGFIVFDNKRRFINANDFVKNYFPEINEWQTEQRVKICDSYLYNEVITWYYAWTKGIRVPKSIKVGDIYFELTIREITNGRKNKVIGALIEFADRTAEHKYTETVEKYNAELSEEVEAKTAHINDIKDKMVIGMAAMVESRDNSTGGHIQRTSEVVSMFAGKLAEHADELGIDYEFIDLVIRAAPMHDLGKISVDDAILRKQGKFTDEEYAKMKEHSAEGAKIVHKILKDVEDDIFVEVAENVAHYHHEKWNGTGYPCGLSGKEIPIEARIMALADVFDALVSKRCYKEPFDYDRAFGIIENDLGTHFDPVLGKLFLECKNELMGYYDVVRAQE